jgi:hypothetical protein
MAKISQPDQTEWMQMGEAFKQTCVRLRWNARRADRELRKALDSQKIRTIGQHYWHPDGSFEYRNIHFCIDDLLRWWNEMGPRKRRGGDRNG